jgi:hypothetical protein
LKASGVTQSLFDETASTIEAVPAAGVVVFGGSGKLAAIATVHTAPAIAAAVITHINVLFRI